MRFVVPEECFLLELPPELRERIYQAVYEDVGECVLLVMGKENCVERLSPENDHYNDEGDIFQPQATALLRTCKQIYREAAPVLLDSAFFRIILAGPLSYSPSGKPLGNIASCWFFPWMRQVRLTLANDFESMLSNLDLFLHAQRNNKRLDVRAVYLDFNFLITSTSPPHNFFSGKSRPLVDRLPHLPRREQLQMYNMSLPGSYLIPPAEMEALVAAVGGIDHTFPEKMQKNNFRPKGRHPRQEVERLAARHDAVSEHSDSSRMDERW